MTANTIRALAALALVTATASHGAETSYSGTGTYFATRVLMPMGNGGAAVKMDNEVVLSIAPSEYGFLFGECTGLGYISPEGKFSSTAYCTLREDATHSLDIRAQRTEDSASGEIIGGSGRWEGATGSMQLNSKFEEGSRGSFDYSMKLTTP
jgi:hypothetical protein